MNVKTWSHKCSNLRQSLKIWVIFMQPGHETHPSDSRCYRGDEIFYLRFGYKPYLYK